MIQQNIKFQEFLAKVATLPELGTVEAEMRLQNQQYEFELRAPALQARRAVLMLRAATLAATPEKTVDRAQLLSDLSQHEQEVLRFDVEWDFHTECWKEHNRLLGVRDTD